MIIVPLKTGVRSNSATRRNTKWASSPACTIELDFTVRHGYVGRSIGRAVTAAAAAVPASTVFGRRGVLDIIAGHWAETTAAS